MTSPKKTPNRRMDGHKAVGGVPDSGGEDRFGTQDWAVVIVLLIAAGTLRFWKITSLGLTHFDEGSYAMAGKWIATWGQEGWPIQAGHAPALFPLLVGLSFKIFGIADYIAVAVSATAGTATVAVIYWIGSHWFGRTAGVMAAVFLAVSEYHLIYSRLALTDATFTLLFWAALGAYSRGIQMTSSKWMAWAGLFTGLCWNTKYHGFFPLLIAALWVIGASLTGDKTDSSSLRIRCLVPAAVLALALFVPWILVVQFTIGYGAILSGQISHSAIERGLIVTPPDALLFYLNSWLTPPLLAGAVLGIIVALVLRRRAGLFLVFTAAFFLTMTIFYLSFPRLILPVIPAFCLLAAFGLHRTSQAVGLGGGRIVTVAGTLMILVWSLLRAYPLLQLSTDTYRQASEYIETLQEPVITQLSKNYYFYEKRKSREIRWQRLEDLNLLLEGPESGTLAIDPIIYRQPDIVEWIETLRPRLKLLRRFEVSLYEPLYYQGFDPTLDLRRLPRSVAPIRPQQRFLYVYRIAGK